MPSLRTGMTLFSPEQEFHCTMKPLIRSCNLRVDSSGIRTVRALAAERNARAVLTAQAVGAHPESFPRRFCRLVPPLLNFSGSRQTLP